MKRSAEIPQSSMKKWLKKTDSRKPLPISEQSDKSESIKAEAQAFKCIRPVTVKKGESTGSAYKRAKKERGNLRNVCSTQGIPAKGFEGKTYDKKNDCQRSCYIEEKEEIGPSVTNNEDNKKNAQASNPESALVIKATPPKDQAETSNRRQPQTSSAQKKESNKKPSAKPPKNNFGQKFKKSVEDNRRAVRGMINKTRREIKELQPEPFNVGPVKIPESVVAFLEQNAKRFELIALGLWDFPFELTFHLLKEIGHIVHILAIGFLWIAVWMAVEALAIYGSQGVLKTIFTIVNSIITAVDLIIDALTTMLFGVVVDVLQVALCKFAPLKAMLSSNLQNLICNDVPGFGNPFPIPRFNLDKFIPETWDELTRMRTTCAEFSSGPEVLEGVIKLIFSPSLCPVVKHVRPVKWLHSLFYYTVGTLTWEQGTTGTYTDPLASIVTKQSKNAGVRGNASCEAPPDALYCIIFGLGFLIV